MRSVLEIARQQLRANVPDARAAALTMWTGRRRTTGRAHPAQALWVYGRAGAPCRRCATPIEMVKQGPDARVTYYCPTASAERRNSPPYSARGGPNFSSGAVTRSSRRTISTMASGRQGLVRKASQPASRAAVEASERA